MSEHAPVGGALVPADAPARRLLEAFLAGRSPETVRAYRKDLADVTAFLGAATPQAAALQFLANGPGPANALALAYKNDLLQRGLAPATVNRRLAAVRSLAKLGRTLGMVGWGLEVEGVRSEAYRDTRGPGRDGLHKLLARLQGRSDAKGLRDRAALRLLFDLALRRGEVVGLDVGDLDLETGTLAVLGKGRREKVRLTLPTPTREVLRAWLAARGGEPGPLFPTLAPGRRGRLTGSGLYRVIRGLGAEAGLPVRPHLLRHSAITAALDATNGDVRRVQRFSRHAKLDTLMVYDDRRKDEAADVARLVAGGG